jgi:FkbM family methyltransferase
MMTTLSGISEPQQDFFSIHAAARVKHVVAFEPDPAAVVRLKQKIELNRLDGRIDVRATGIGADEAVLELASDGLHGHAPVLGLANLGRHTKVVSVPVTSMDRLVEGDLQRPSAIKIDIEGAEGLALDGGRKLLAGKVKPRLILIELHPQYLPKFGSSVNAICDTLSTAGYKCMRANDRYEQTHLLAVAI